jgi:hypothetical protein
MSVTQVSLATTPYMIGTPTGAPTATVAAPGAGGPAPPAGAPVKHRNIHTIYPTVAGAITVVLAAPTFDVSMTKVAGALGAPGDGYFLPYFPNEITSIRLPSGAPATTLFFTGPLDGCKIYVDAINGSNDLIVYHANTYQHPPAANADADVQTPAANALLDAMHLAAQGDYAPLGLNNLASLAKPTYFGRGGQEERRKALQGRTETATGGTPKFNGQCSIFGFPVGISWQFWFQTCGNIKYHRPMGKAGALFTGHWNTLTRLRREGPGHVASNRTAKVFDYQRFL